jgi:hypothetical protein
LLGDLNMRHKIIVAHKCRAEHCVPDVSPAPRGIAAPGDPDLTGRGQQVG